MTKNFTIPALVILFLFALFCGVGAAAPAPLTVNFINVGEGDCILIQTPNHQTMLIDAGSIAAAPSVVSYLNSRHVRSIDALVATHPHADHIGGMAKIIYDFPVENIYLPKVATNTWTYGMMMAAIKNKRIKVWDAQAGMFINIDHDLMIEILAPHKGPYADLNDYSVVIKLIYGKTSFLFTGDASQASEKEMLKSKHNLHADVLKVARHGSIFATTAKFIKAVSPAIAVISVGASNRYDYPGFYTLDKLKKAGIQLFRTDRNGNIQISSDGHKLTVRPERLW